MRKLISSFILGIAVLCFSSPAHAEWVYVLVDFEEYAGAIGGNSAWGGRPGYDSVVPFPDSPGFVKTDGPDLWGFFPTTQTQYTSNGATFNHFNGSDDMFGMNFWSGVGLSSRTDYWSDTTFTNEMASLTGSGYNGSSVYAVAYAGLAFDFTMDINDPLQTTIISFDTAVDLLSIAVTLTAYTQDHILNGSGFGPTGDTLGLNIYGFGADWTQRDKVFLDLTLLTDWTLVDLTSLFDVQYLAFEYVGNAGAVPAYFAFDNIYYRYDDGTAAVPEPATLAVFGLGLIGLGIARPRRRK